MMVDHRPIRLMYALLLAVAILACGENGDDVVRSASVAVEDVLEEQRALVDTSRPTRANGTAAALDHRQLATRLWYAPAALATPACRGDRCALVLLAHGFGGRTSRFDALARELAAVGYIVAAPTFPLTNQDTPGGHFTGLTDAAEQPADVSFVIDELLAADRDPADPLRGRMDTTRIGAVGHSLGGATVIGATRGACCSDARIDAAVLVAPAAVAVAPFYGGPASPEGPPVLVVNGSEDPLIRPATSLDFARTLNPPWYYLEIADVGHVFLIENIGEPQSFLFVTARAARAFLDEYLGGARGDTAATIAALVAEGQTAEYAE